MSKGTQLAGDQYVDFLLAEITKARKKLPGMINAAETAANHIVDRNGGLLAAGDDGFAMEQIWRSAGFGFAKRFKPQMTESTARLESSEKGLTFHQTVEFERRFFVREARPDDVALLGYESEREEQARLAEDIQRLLDSETLIVFFGSESVAKEIRRRFGKRKNLIPLTHRVRDGGLLQIPGWPDKVCSGRGLINRLYLWVFVGELIAAFLRRGKVPGVLLSATYESPQILNIPLIDSYHFIPAFNVAPIKKGVLGTKYLDHLRGIVSSLIRDQRAQFRKAAQWLAEAVRNKRKIRALTIESLRPVGLPGNPTLFENYIDPGDYDAEVKKAGPDEVALYVGYNWYPTALGEAVDKAGGKLILCITLVQDFPPKPVDLGEPFVQVASLKQLPRRENHVYINLKFDQYDGCLMIPGYPIPVLPTSFISVPLVYWHLVADTVELLAKQ